MNDNAVKLCPRCGIVGAGARCDCPQRTAAVLREVEIIRAVKLAREFLDTIDALRAERDAARGDTARLREAAALKRNVLIDGGDGFVGEWIAVPREDFKRLRVALNASLEQEGQT